MWGTTGSKSRCVTTVSTKNIFNWTNKQTNKNWTYEVLTYSSRMPLFCSAPVCFEFEISYSLLKKHNDSAHPHHNPTKTTHCFHSTGWGCSYSLIITMWWSVFLLLSAPLRAMNVFVPSLGVSWLNPSWQNIWIHLYGLCYGLSVWGKWLAGHSLCWHAQSS